MIEQLKEIYGYVILYIPTVLTAIGTILSYIKIFKGLKQEDLKKEIESTKMLLKQQAQDNEQLKNLNKELINEISKVRKYEDVKTNKDI